MADELRRLFEALVSWRLDALAVQVVAKTILVAYIENDRGRAQTLGTCVLIQVDGHDFVVTAGHVLDDVGDRPLYVGPVQQSQSVGIPFSRRFRTGTGDLSDDPYDLAVMPLGTANRKVFDGSVFLGPDAMDPQDEPDFSRLEQNHYQIIGLPASRSPVRIEPQRFLIHQTSFQLDTFPAPLESYAGKDLDPEKHLLLHYDRRALLVHGARRNPPKLEGLSGAATFRLLTMKPEVKLVAIAIEIHKAQRLIVTTRIAHAIDVARRIIRDGDPALFR